MQLEDLLAYKRDFLAKRHAAVRRASAKPRVGSVLTVALIVLYDACVLYPASLRDLLVRLAVSDPPKTTAEFLVTLEQCQLPEAAARLRPFAADLFSHTHGRRNRFTSLLGFSRRMCNTC